jgi:trans-2,3-dihydro-3-hydroxyanthranilate isomerase
MVILPYQLCDVFTDRALTGNALAVFTDARGLDEERMLALAREMRLSECAFVLPATTPDADARIRIFTPAMELPFAGHPVLGTAFVLAGTVEAERQLRLETARGIFQVRLEPTPKGVAFGWMTQPLPIQERFGPARELLASLGLARSALPIELYDNGPRHVQVELDAPSDVARVRPDMARLSALGSLAVSVFARTERGYKTRVFAPGEGIDEDPATGAAAGPLVLHLIRHARARFGEEVVIEQGEELRRPSQLHARVYGTSERLERIEVGGHAVVIGGGELRLI